MGEPGVGRMRDRLLLYSGIYRNPFEISGVDRPGAVGHREPHQRMAKVDDLLERRAKQVVLAIVARLAHRSPPTANLAVEGITDRPNRESQTARKPACTPGFLAKSITCSGQIIAIDQSLPNSSRTTKYCSNNS